MVNGGRDMNTYGEPIRTLRIADDLWKSAKRRAERDKTTVTAIIRQALTNYVRDED